MTEISSRPFLRHSIADLEEIASSNWNDIVTITMVVVELFHRDIWRASCLREKSIDRIGELIAQGFPWPSVEVEPSSHTSNLFIDAAAQGLLACLGYRVGQHGLNLYDRRLLLTTVFMDRLPPVNSAEYMQSWGVPETSQRLRIIADSIAAFVRNAKRRKNIPTEAVADWTDDLDFLHAAFYKGRYDFPWPSTTPD